MTREEFYAELYALAEPDYRDFNAGLLPGVANILGVRMPALRRIAKRIAAGDWRAFLAAAREESYEETMVQALVIGLAKGSPEEILSYVAAFVPKIDNWAVCDCFCGGLKLAQRHPGLVWDFVRPYFSSPQPFAVRFALVMALNHYMQEPYLDEVLELIDGVKLDHHYVKMAAAWAVSFCFIHDPGRTKAYLQNNTLDEFTYSKSLSKILESYRVSPEDKEFIRALRKNKAAR